MHFNESFLIFFILGCHLEYFLGFLQFCILSLFLFFDILLNDNVSPYKIHMNWILLFLLIEIRIDGCQLKPIEFLAPKHLNRFNVINKPGSLFLNRTES